MHDKTRHFPWRVFGVSLLCSILNSCAVSINTTGPRFESPEAVGPLKSFEIFGGLAQGHKVTMDDRDIITRKNPNPDNPTIERRKGAVHAGFRAGLIDEIELSYSATGTLRGKFQFLGDSAKNSKKGNFSMAVTGSYGIFDEANDWDGLFSSSDIDGTLYEASLPIGYRFNPSFLMYMGPYVAHRDYEVKTYETSTNSQGQSTATLIATKEGYLTQKGAFLGVEFRGAIGEKVFGGLRIEATYTEIKAGNNFRKDGFSGIQGFILF